MINCYFVRHGFARHNEAFNMIGESAYDCREYEDAELCDLGHIQTKEVGDKLSHIEFDYVYCSPLVRCIQTCVGIVKHNKYLSKIQLNDNLIELEHTLCNKRKNYDDLVFYLNKTYPEHKFNMTNVYDNYNYYSPVDMSERIKKINNFHKVIMNIKNIDSNKNINILVVTHCDWLGTYFMQHHNINISPSNCEITTVQIPIPNK